MTSVGSGPIVVGVDGSEESRAALELAMGEADLRGVELHVVHVVDLTPATIHLAGGSTTSTREIADEMHRTVFAALSEVLDRFPDAKEVRLIGYPADEVADHCEEVGAALLVLGTRGRGRIKSAVLGSTSLRALEHAPCPVLIAKGRPGLA